MCLEEDWYNDLNIYSMFNKEYDGYKEMKNVDE